MRAQNGDRILVRGRIAVQGLHIWPVFAVSIGSAIVAAQSPARVQALVAALGPVLPFPAATADGALPAEGGAASKWFVVWPSEPQDTIVTVKANPLHPDIQKAGTTADGSIQQAIVAAERKAQAAYDRALEELRRTGKTGGFDDISLEDEGAAGERIDAELEVTIELAASVASYELSSSEEPQVREGTNGVAWTITVPPNTYKATTGPDTREHFRPSETRLYFGMLPRPGIDRQGNTPRYRVTVQPSAGVFAVIVRGNHDLVGRIVSTADWGRVSRTAP
jgi:hypothetical protein